MLPARRADRVGRFVLGRQARILDPADRQRFNSRYTLLLKGTLQKEMLRLQVSEFEIISVTSRSERDQIVHTRVKTQDGRTEDLRFRLIKFPFEIWLVARRVPHFNHILRFKMRPVALLV